MKKSLTHKVLILSLAALVIAGSGCERRGRAAKKTAPQDVSGEAGSGDSLVKKENPASGKVSKEEEALLTEARIECPKIERGLPNLIDADEAPSAETMTTDISSMVALRECLGGDEKNAVKGFGVKAIKVTTKDGTARIWHIDGDALDGKGDEVRADGSTRETHSPLFTEFSAYATLPGMKDTDAKLVMQARIAVLKLNAEKMLTKYAKLPAETPLKEGEDPTVGKTLTAFSEVVTACDEATKIVDGYATVRDGVDLTKPVSEMTPEEAAAHLALAAKLPNIPAAKEETSEEEAPADGSEAPAEVAASEAAPDSTPKTPIGPQE